jgi:hypothetical protein
MHLNTKYKCGLEQMPHRSRKDDGRSETDCFGDSVGERIHLQFEQSVFVHSTQFSLSLVYAEQSVAHRGIRQEQRLVFQRQYVWMAEQVFADMEFIQRHVLRRWRKNCNDGLA